MKKAAEQMSNELTIPEYILMCSLIIIEISSVNMACGQNAFSRSHSLKKIQIVLSDAIIMPTVKRNILLRYHGVDEFASPRLTIIFESSN